MSRSLEEEIMIKAQQVRGTARYMASFEDLVEEKIRKAQEKGAFDNLEGHGKPLDLSENPFEPPELRMVFKILKDQGFAPAWIEIGKEVDARQVELKYDVARFKDYARVVGTGASKRGMSRLEHRAKVFLKECMDKLQIINRRIDDFNNNCPMWWLSRGRININQEYALIKAEVDEAMLRLRETNSQKHA
ncbi:MAG: DUF1992 domain-containing protein [Candidatus Saccharibacteria bacterium]